MIHLLIFAVHLLATIAKLVRPGGVRAVVAESLVLKHQLLISSRARRPGRICTSATPVRAQ
jgi:putative transposase